MGYNYELEQSLIEDYTEAQAQKLLSDGYIYNSEEETYDKYKIKKETVEYVDFYYFEEKEVDSQLGEYEVYKNRKITNVKYKTLKKETGITGFFKNIFNKFISTTEKNVSETRIQELELLLAKSEIKDLKKTEAYSITGAVEKLTDKEVKELQKKGIKYSFLRMLDKTQTKREKIKIRNKQVGLEMKHFNEDFKDEYETEIIRIYEEKKIKEKLVIDRRVIMETTINFYIPGVWSRMGNHQFGTIAEFSCEVVIKYISGFNPFDKKYFNKEDIREGVIDIIENEHYNTKFIREREDRRDGFKIEKTNTTD